MYQGDTQGVFQIYQLWAYPVGNQTWNLAWSRHSAPTLVVCPWRLCLLPRASVLPMGQVTPLPRSGELLLIHQNPSSHTYSSRLQPGGLEADSSKAGLGIEAMMMEHSPQNPAHHQSYFVLWWKGTVYRLSKSYLNWAWTGELACAPSSPWDLGQGWGQVTKKNFKKYRKTRKYKHVWLVQSTSF